MGHLRITGGVHCSRQLEVPVIPGLRPAQDRVRAAVFSALDNWVPDARVLDLFAGTGAYGIEKGLVFSFPTRSNGRSWETIEGVALSDFSRSRIALTEAELKEERALVADLLPKA